MALRDGSGVCRTYRGFALSHFSDNSDADRSSSSSVGRETTDDVIGWLVATEEGVAMVSATAAWLCDSVYVEVAPVSKTAIGGRFDLVTRGAEGLLSLRLLLRNTQLTIDIRQWFENRFICNKYYIFINI